MIRKIGILIMLIMNTAMLSGCWDRIEINDIAIVEAVGIDKIADDEISLSVLLPVPKLISTVGGSGGGGSDKPRVILYSERGKNVIDAFRRLQQKLPREIMFSHIRLIVIGERLAQDGVAGVLDFFTRYRQANLRAHILFTQENVDMVLEGEPGIEREMAGVIREEGEMGLCIKTDLKDFLNMLTEEGINPIAGQLVSVPMTIQAQSEVGNEKTKKPYNSIKGAAVFHKDKLVGWLNEEEVKGVLWFQNQIKDGTTITVAIPEEKGGGKVGVRTVRAKSALQPKIDGDVLTIDMSTDTEVNIYDDSSKIDISDPKSIYLLENALEVQIENRIQNTLDTLQKYGWYDVLGLGTVVYRKYPKEWREKYKDQWDEEFSRLNVQITGKVSIKRIGFITNPLTKKEDEIKK